MTYSRAGALALVCISFAVSIVVTSGSPAFAQTAAGAQQQTLPPVRVEAPTERKRNSPSRPSPERQAARRQPRPARPSAPQEATTTIATRTEEPVIDTLAAVSTRSSGQIGQAQPARLSDVLNGMPGVWSAERGDDPAAAINIRGLQDFGRVATLIDGAPQDFQRSGHFANGLFYLDPELLGGADIVRGPVANIYGSGAIGGVASFRTKDIDDILRPGETQAIESHGMYGTNGNQWLGSTFAGIRTDAVDVLAGGVYRDSGNYREGTGSYSSLQCASNCAGYPITVLPGGAVVPNTGNEAESGMVKLTVRPGEGQQIKLSAITYNTDYNFGATNGAGTTIPGIGVYGENIKNQTVSGQYSFKSPESPLVDFNAGAYWNQTNALETVKIPYVAPCGPGCSLDVSGPAGSTSGFLLNTAGFNVNNTSRFDTGALRHTVTYGGDFNNDAVNVNTGCATDQLISGTCNISLTPNGHRSTYGSFVEWKTNYSTWFEMINAVRYDGFELSGGGTSESGQRLSPKTTLGLTPIAGLTPYVTYAEGYRAPSVTEAFIAGFHPGGFLYFEPNPNLQPEVGKTKEIGLNIKYDSVFTAGDKIRAKVNVFRNDVYNYIDVVQAAFTFGPPTPPCIPTPFGYSACYQYQNIGNARIEGIEFEASYDAGEWYAGLSGQHITGQSVTSSATLAANCAAAPMSSGCPGAPLATVPPDQLSLLLGARLFDRRLNLSMRWTAVAAKPLSAIPTTTSDSGAIVPIFDSSRSYNLINLYASYQVTPEVLAGFSIENLLNENYARYTCCSTNSGYVVPNPGITVKGSLTIHYGVKGNG